MGRQKDWKLSIIIPLLNEEACLPLLIQRLEAVMRKLGCGYELILVDDCSTDSSFEVIALAARGNPAIRALRLSRNKGHQAALACGLEVAQGDVVITMDADLQHPPELVPALLDLWQQGYDVVNTARRNSADAKLVKRLVSRAFYAVFNRISDVPLTPNSSDFRLLDRKCADALRSMGEYHKFYRGLIHDIGFRQTVLTFDCQPRAAGRTKYTFRKSLHLASSGIFSFSTLPLKVPFFLGLTILGGLSFLFAIAVFLYLTGRYQFVPGWTSLIAIMLLMFGVDLLFMGLFGLYLAKIFIEIKARPLYFIDRSIGFEAPAALAPKRPTAAGVSIGRS